MPHANGASHWLMQFDNPLPGEMAELRTILAAATVASARTENRLRGELEHALAVEGSLDHIVARLADHLAEDYTRNRGEQSREPRGVDYVVADRFPENAAIDVRTRLLDPSDGGTGDLLNGRSILRIDDDRYIVWLDA